MASEMASGAHGHIRQIQLVGRMTELNSRHLKSEGRRGGLEVEITRCEEAIARGDRSEDFRTVLDVLRKEWMEVERIRREIDRERERLSAELRALEGPH